MCVERIESYHFVVDAMFETTPLASKSDIRIIFGDSIMDESLLVRLGINSTCHLGYDVYHLLNIDWPKQYLWSLLEESFKRFAYANSEEECEQALASINAMLQGRTRHLEYMQNEVICHKQNIVACFMRKVEGKFVLFAQVTCSNHSLQQVTCFEGETHLLSPTTQVMWLELVNNPGSNLLWQ